MSKTVKLILAAVVALAILIPAGTFAYINFIREDAPDELAGVSSNCSAGTGEASADFSNGRWRPLAECSQVGYRVDEVLFGQNVTAAGRTNRVTGDLGIANDTVNEVALSVDLASVASDDRRRDEQFRGRIMSVDQFPNATYRLTQPIRLPQPVSSTTQTVSATGDLTLRGVTRSVTTDLRVRRLGQNVEVNGSIPVRFSDFNIPNPSIPPGISTEDNGVLEFLVVFEPSS